MTFGNDVKKPSSWKLAKADELCAPKEEGGRHKFKDASGGDNHRECLRSC